MLKRYLIKYAWQGDHEILGDIVCFVATPYSETSPNNFGYVISSGKDEVFRMASDSKQAKMILHKLTKLGNSQWTHPDTDYLIEIEFNMDVFFEEEIYQENEQYKRNVLFHTDCDLI